MSRRENIRRGTEAERAPIREVGRANPQQADAMSFARGTLAGGHSPPQALRHDQRHALDGARRWGAPACMRWAPEAPVHGLAPLPSPGAHASEARMGILPVRETVKRLGRTPRRTCSMWSPPPTGRRQPRRLSSGRRSESLVKKLGRLPNVWFLLVSVKSPNCVQRPQPLHCRQHSGTAHLLGRLDVRALAGLNHSSESTRCVPDRKAAGLRLWIRYARQPN